MARTGRVALLLTWATTAVLGRVSARLARRAALRLWFTPWRGPASARVRDREAAWLRDTTPITVDVGTQRLAGFRAPALADHDAGAAPTVLLVHGWADHGARLGAFVAPLVAAGYRVVAVDLPGHGASGNGRTDIPSQAAALRRVAAEVGGVHAVIAHSLGAASTTAALRDGLATQAVILLAPAVRLEHAVQRFGAMFRLPHKAMEGLRRGLEQRFGATVWDDYAGDHIAASLDVPALIIHDADDPQIDVADATLLAEAWPGARLIVTHGLGHQRLIRDAGVVAQVVQALGTMAPAAGAGGYADAGGIVAASEASSPR